jgi:hypothetical protein
MSRAVNSQTLSSSEDEEDHIFSMADFRKKQTKKKGRKCGIHLKIR